MDIIKPSINKTLILLSLGMFTDLTVLYSFVRQKKQPPGLPRAPL